MILITASCKSRVVSRELVASYLLYLTFTYFSLSAFCHPRDQSTFFFSWDEKHMQISLSPEREKKREFVQLFFCATLIFFVFSFLSLMIDFYLAGNQNDEGDFFFSLKNYYYVNNMPSWIYKDIFLLHHYTLKLRPQLKKRQKKEKVKPIS